VVLDLASDLYQSATPQKATNSTGNEEKRLSGARLHLRSAS